MKQTAVEWLKYQMLEASIDRETEEMYIKLPKDAFKQAKQMEKEQIMDDFMAGQWAWKEHLDGKDKKDPAQYYNETFKSE